MNTRSICLSFVVLGLWTPGSAPAANVTFQVDMSIQVARGSFDPATDQVVVAGDPLNGWSTSESVLTPGAANPGIWTGTFDIPAATGSTVQYKFVAVRDSGVVWEGNVGAGGGNGNRTFPMADTDMVLPVVFFNNVTNAATVSPVITFQADMSVQNTLGNFDPASGTVSVAGEFNAWSTTAFELTNSVARPHFFTGAVKITGTPNSSVMYKLVMNGGTWEGNVGAGGAQNRSFTLSATNQVLPVLFFNNLAAVPTVIPLTFQVDLSVQTALGKFNPESDTVLVAGEPLNGWSASASPLARSLTQPNLWVGTFEVTNSTGGTLLYKYVVNEGTWETGENRSYTFTSTEPQSVPIAYFDRVNNLGPLSIHAATGGGVTLSWTAAPRVRLESTGDPVQGPWTTVPNTEGQGSASVDIGPARQFFRLSGP